MNAREEERIEPEPHSAEGSLDERATRQRVILACWLAAAAALAYLCRNSIAVAEKTIREDLRLSEDTMGFILGPAFFWSYALFQIPGGGLGQRFGSRKCLAIFNGLSSFGTACIALSTGGLALLTGRLGVGVAQAGLFPCSTISLSRWYPRVERALASAVLGSAMSIGGAIGAGLTGQLLTVLSWRTIFLVYALPGVFWSVLFYWWFRDRPADHPRVNQAELDLIGVPVTASPTGSSKSDDDLDQRVETVVRRVLGWSWRSQFWWKLRSFCRRWSMWCICGQQFFRAAGYAFFSSWFATYLQETRDVSTEQSGWLLMVPLLATVIASLIGGGLSDRIFRQTGQLRPARAGLAGVSLLVCAVLVFSAYFVSNAGMATLIIAAGAFFAAFAGPCAYAATIDIGGRNVATVFGSMNMIGNFGAGLLPWMVPSFRRWVAGNANLLKLVGGNSWNSILLLFASMYVLAAACWFVMPLHENELENI